MLLMQELAQLNKVLLRQVVFVQLTHRQIKLLGQRHLLDFGRVVLVSL